MAPSESTGIPKQVLASRNNGIMNRGSGLLVFMSLCGMGCRLKLFSSTALRPACLSDLPSSTQMSANRSSMEPACSCRCSHSFWSKDPSSQATPNQPRINPLVGPMCKLTMQESESFQCRKAISFLPARKLESREPAILCRVKAVFGPGGSTQSK